MTAIVIICLFWLGYGIAGILGYQNIPSKYEGQPWTAQYKRCNGISWILLAAPTLICCAAVWLLDLNRAWCIWATLIFCLPALIYSISFTRRFDRLVQSSPREASGES